MIALTSISSITQEDCVLSWLDCKLKVFSFNSPKEIEGLKKDYPYVTFIPTHRTMEHKFGRPYVQINAMLDWAKDRGEDILIINADILLIDAKEVLGKGFSLAKEGLAYAHRIDIEDPSNLSGAPYEWGMDVFFVGHEHLNVFPQTLYCMGQTFWDYWLPYTAKKSGLKVTEIKEPFAYHIKHPQNWQEWQWNHMAEHAMWVEGVRGCVQLSLNQQKRNTSIISSLMYKEIKR